MRRRQISKDAEVVWRVLNETTNRSCDYNELKKKTELTDKALNRALGWLSYEESIDIDDESNIIFIPSLPFF